MSDTKFTKGDWFIGNYSTILDVSAVDYGAVCSVECDYREYQITPTDEQQANAHLIAAAPDMYKLLIEFKSFAERQVWDHALINDAEKTLTKARGE